jgi:hypothetical protein
MELYAHQKKALDRLRSGCILVGGVGTGKSRTALAYYYCKECKGDILDNCLMPMKEPKDLYIITTARKRDTLEWDAELIPFGLEPSKIVKGEDTRIVIDSWNNIVKYKDVKDSFFIFDEQRAVGSGTWAKTFIKIAKQNHWIMLSATPGDVWADYIPVFVANGFYKNKSDFARKHIVYSPFTKYPKIQRYLDTDILENRRRAITVTMKFKKESTQHHKMIFADYDRAQMKILVKDRWNIYTDKPIKDVTELCYAMRKLVNTDKSRIDIFKDLVYNTQKAIVFYNFDYELELLRDVLLKLEIPFSEWNGHRHLPIPKTDRWVYLVQYNAGAEGWNCVETDTMIFYSLNYSYKMMTQAAGRIDRMNTPYTDLYYYKFTSGSQIDGAIAKALENKKTFNEKQFQNFLE